MPNRFARLACMAFFTAALVGCGHSSTAPSGAAATASAAAGGSASASGAVPATSAGAVGGSAPADDGGAATGSGEAGGSAAANGRVAARQSEPAISQSDTSDCLAAAKNVLGQDAEVLKCGFLNQHDVLESVAIVRKQLNHKTRDDFASRLVILRRVNSSWVTALDASQGTRNDVGYIATDFLDDDVAVWGYRVKLYRTLPDGDRKFTLEVAPMHDARDSWAVGTEISWDGSVRRYREFSVDGGTFQAENKSPPHIHVKKAATSSAAARTHS
jgi:hypothetical protein